MTQGRDIPCNNCNDGGVMGGLCYCDDEQAAHIADLEERLRKADEVIAALGRCVAGDCAVRAALEEDTK